MPIFVEGLMKRVQHVAVLCAILLVVGSTLTATGAEAASPARVAGAGSQSVASSTDFGKTIETSGSCKADGNCCDHGTCASTIGTKRKTATGAAVEKSHTGSECGKNKKSL